MKNAPATSSLLPPASASPEESPRAPESSCAERGSRGGRWSLPDDFDWVLDRPAAVAAWVALAVGLVMPSTGFSFSFCAMYATLHLPCPGCGMTRGVSSFLHGDWLLSWRYHPMGWAAALLIVAVAGSALCPRGWREGARRWMAARRRPIARILWSLLGVWLAYGLARIALVAAGAWRFPPG